MPDSQQDQSAKVGFAVRTSAWFAFHLDIPTRSAQTSQHLPRDPEGG